MVNARQEKKEDQPDSELATLGRLVDRNDQTERMVVIEEESPEVSEILALIATGFWESLRKYGTRKAVAGVLWRSVGMARKRKELPEPTLTIDELKLAFFEDVAAAFEENVRLALANDTGDFPGKVWALNNCFSSQDAGREYRRGILDRYSLGEPITLKKSSFVSNSVGYLDALIKSNWQHLALETRRELNDIESQKGEIYEYVWQNVYRALLEELRLEEGVSLEKVTGPNPDF